MSSLTCYGNAADVSGRTFVACADGWVGVRSFNRPTLRIFCAASACTSHPGTLVRLIKAYLHAGSAATPQVPPPLNVGELPASLAATLQHIVGQLDVLTQTMGLMDQRLTMAEDRARRTDDKVNALVNAHLAAHPPTGGSDEGIPAWKIAPRT